MKLSPLQPGPFYFTEVKINVQSKSKREDVNKVDVVVEPFVNCPDPKEPRKWVVSVRVKFYPKDDVTAPYYGEVEAVGGFLVAETWPDANIEKLVYVNGSGLIYSAIREMICNITARSFFDIFRLPAWSFLEMYKETEELKKREAEKSQPSLPLKQAESTTAQSPTAP